MTLHRVHVCAHSRAIPDEMLTQTYIATQIRRFVGSTGQARLLHYRCVKLRTVGEPAPHIERKHDVLLRQESGAIYRLLD